MCRAARRPGPRDPCHTATTGHKQDSNPGSTDPKPHCRPIPFLLAKGPCTAHPHPPPHGCAAQVGAGPSHPNAHGAETQRSPWPWAVVLPSVPAGFSPLVFQCTKNTSVVLLKNQKSLFRKAAVKPQAPPTGLAQGGAHATPCPQRVRAEPWPPPEEPPGTPTGDRTAPEHPEGWEKAQTPVPQSAPPGSTRIPRHACPGTTLSTQKSHSAGDASLRQHTAKTVISKITLTAPSYLAQSLPTLKTPSHVLGKLRQREARSPG